MRLSEEVLAQARTLITARLGLDFPEARRADLERGLQHVLERAAAGSPERWVAALATLPDESPEWRRLAGALTVGETYFFRDRACMEALDQQLLPALIEARRAAGHLRLRLWSAGCATGAEPYSLAILLDQLLPDREKWAVTILATDINEAALDQAHQGLYSEWALRETPGTIVARYFHRRGKDSLELDPAIRRMVTFAPLNLAAGGFPSLITNTSAMDLIVCRNVLMYFTGERQRAVAARFHEALVAGGWLVVAPAETSIELFRPLVPVNLPGTIFYRKAPDSSAPAPSIAPEPPDAEPAGAWWPTSAPADHRLALPPEEPQGPERPPPDQAEVLRQIRRLADQGLLEEARRACEGLLAQDRLNADASLLLAAICQEQGETATALEALRQTIYLAPNSAPAHFMAGCLFFRQGDRQRGRRFLETVVSLLRSVAPEDIVPGSDGLTAGRMRETARAYLEMQS
ncbi:CheR family methyltransferase [Nitrospira sp. Kam-Ns4a]